MKKIFWKMKNAILILFLILMVSFVFLLAYPSILYSLRDILNPNKIIVKTSSEINIDNINIIWHTGGQNPINIYSNGKEAKITYKEYGDNYFIVTYNNDTLVTFGYFKTNNWHGHKHTILINKDDIKVSIKGPDERSFFILE